MVGNTLGDGSVFGLQAIQHPSWVPPFQYDFKTLHDPAQPTSPAPPSAPSPSHHSKFLSFLESTQLALTSRSWHVPSPPPTRSPFHSTTTSTCTFLLSQLLLLQPLPDPPPSPDCVPALSSLDCMPPPSQPLAQWTWFLLTCVSLMGVRSMGTGTMCS